MSPRAFPALGLTFAIAGLSACGNGHADQTGRATTAGEAEGKRLVVRTRVDIRIPTGGPAPGASIGGGSVLHGSFIGNKRFCTGARFSDRHGDPERGLVDRTFHCRDGSLSIGFTPGAPHGRTQAGPWKVLSGTGAFEGLQGRGQMEVKYVPGTDATRGHERFTGTVVP